MGRLPACLPRWVTSRLVYRSGSPPGLSTEVGRLPACLPRWVTSRLVYRSGSPPGLSTEVGRLPACLPRWVTSRLVYRSGSPPGLSTEVGRRRHGSCPEMSVLGRRFLSPIFRHISLHHVHVPELRSASAVHQEQSGLGLYWLHRCYLAVFNSHTSAVFTSSGVMAGPVHQLSSV